MEVWGVEPQSVVSAQFYVLGHKAHDANQTRYLFFTKEMLCQ